MAPPAHVVVVGGGFTGTVTAIQLARCTQPQPICITVVNPSPDIGRGLAYRFDDDNLLLNVPAGNMSALADDPGHFLRYCQTIDPSLAAGSFVSRRLYGHYLQDTLAQTQRQHPGVLNTVVDEVKHLRPAAHSPGWEVALNGGGVLQADHVVLALGHQAPRFPLPLEDAARQRVLNPWDFDAMHQLPPGQPVLILGTGHTAVDALFCLSQARPPRPLIMASRHGLLPQAHRLNPHAPQPQALPSYLQEAPARVPERLRAFRQHVRALVARGGDWRDALNELRPHTPALWQTLPAAEQVRFQRHLQAYWDVHRHRLAPMAAQRLDSLLASGRVRTLAARLQSVQRHGDGIEAVLRHRRTGLLESVHVCAVVNGTGPSGDVRHAHHPLLGQLLRDGLIQPHPSRLGLRVSPHNQVLNAHHEAVQGLWYVGPMLKAQLWEATAVPELRVHARQLALTLLDHLNAVAIPKVPK